MDSQRPDRPWRARLHEIIFEADTRAGRLFDLLLLASITLSVLVVVLESMPRLRATHGSLLYQLEWGFTLLFTLEYALRLLSVRHPRRYALTFYGLVDLLAIVPTYASLLVPSSRFLGVIRILRLLRIFRILKLSHYLEESYVLWQAIRASRYKITVFLLTVLTLVVILGSLMYVVEGEANGFVDIPTSIYWAVVTLTTVGYGDIAPRTAAGQILASIIMLLGYGILAVPTGIVSAELVRGAQTAVSTQACPACGRQGHEVDARYCKFCGAFLEIT